MTIACLTIVDFQIMADAFQAKAEDLQSKNFTVSFVEKKAFGTELPQDSCLSQAEAISYKTRSCPRGDLVYFTLLCANKPTCKLHAQISVFYAKRDLEASNFPTENETVNSKIFARLRKENISHLIAISYKTKRIQRRPKSYIMVEKGGVQKKEKLCYKDGPTRRRQIRAAVQLLAKTKPPTDLLAGIPQLYPLSESRILELQELCRKWDRELPTCLGKTMYQSDADSGESSDETSPERFFYRREFTKKKDETRTNRLIPPFARIRKEVEAQELKRSESQTGVYNNAETSPIEILLPGQMSATRDELEEVDVRMSRRKFRENTAFDSQDEEWENEMM
jgi:hypothetical protein